MKNLTGLKTALCQMEVVPGRPDLNADFIINEIRLAEERGIDIIVVPEMSVTGYLIGDNYEDEWFVRDVEWQNERIRQATKVGITVVFGSLIIDPEKKGSDGRIRGINAVLVARNGQWIQKRPKTLLPDYRVFDDSRHFFSALKIIDEHNEECRLAKRDDAQISLHEYLQPCVVMTSIGEVKIGAILCEDMWWMDHLHNPAAILVQNGADLIINVSASPWTWQKNRKRHSVVKELFPVCCVPMIYVNNTGIQNNGDNIIVFDGSTTVYDGDGNIVFEFPPYESGTRDFTFAQDMPVITPAKNGDTEELFRALDCAATGMVNMLPSNMRKIVIGVSGGIDSATAAAYYAYRFGPDNVILVNMPMEDISSTEHQRLARKLATNIGVRNYRVIPIGSIVKSIATATNVAPGTLAYENIQARARMEILAAIAQQEGGVFTCNGNKVEMAFGYGTMYADIAGFLALFGDLVKREVYQMADYLNRVIYGYNAIPEECFRIAPSAELANGQTDPFDYGTLDRRGYHDEMVRAFVEFRWNPERFIELYTVGALEDILQLEAGTLDRLFPTAPDFVNDLERCWCLFHNSVFKRVQAPPIPVVSKRAFGMDLREAMLRTYFTNRFENLKQLLLLRDNGKENIVILGGSFLPVGRHHGGLAADLSVCFDKIVVAPCASRSEKPWLAMVDTADQKEMIRLQFGGFPKVEFDFTDLDNGQFTPAYLVDQRYKKKYPDANIWHAVGEDIIVEGREGQSEMQREWQNGDEVFQTLNFVVLQRPGYFSQIEDRPPHCVFMNRGGNGKASSTLMRDKLLNGQSIQDDVTPEVYAYTETHKPFDRLIEVMRKGHGRETA